MSEIFKDIPNYEGLYQISNYGTIKSLIFKNNICCLNRERILTKKYNNKGYEIVILYKNGTHQTKLVHRIMAEVFLKDYSKELEINHKDGNKKNNYIDNLEMCTRKENVRHAINNGLWISPNKNKFGSDNNKSLKIKMIDKKTDEVIKTFGSIVEAKDYFKKESSSNIISCLKGRTKQAYGYKWQYE